MKTILVIEDEQSIADTVVHAITKEGYAAEWRERGEGCLTLLREKDFALVVLDVGLPDISGFELCKAIRTFSSVPVIFLTARDDEIDKIVGLEIGADDYVTKPFSPRELGARIKSVLRRFAAAASAGGENPAGRRTLETGPYSKNRPESRLVIDNEKLLALFDGNKLELTRYEFGLLTLLAQKPGRVFSRETIMRAVWGEDSPSLDRTVDTHVKSLRAKFRDAGADIDPIITHRGTGYALKDDL
ncbi:MAG: Transcriptional regulatory protein CreB [Desulfovibrio sp.]